MDYTVILSNPKIKSKLHRDVLLRPACGEHHGRIYVDGVSVGIRLLADALRRGDLDTAQRLIDRAERRMERRR
jgi:hypothetical protein